LVTNGQKTGHEHPFSVISFRIGPDETRTMPEQNCPFCGRPLRAVVDRCPNCREAIPRITSSSAARKISASYEGRANIRRGLLWTLLAAVLYYFTSGMSPLTLPFAVPGFVTQYLIPLLFLAGVAMAIYGLFQR
jgi:hypothetical protein